MTNSSRRRGVPPVIVWFREDLRITDNPALHAAAATGAPVLPLFILEDDTAGIRPRGGASRWWLHGSLAALTDEIGRTGGRLLLRSGDAREIVPALAAAIGAGAVFFNRRYGGPERQVDAAVEQQLVATGVGVETFSGKLLVEPGTFHAKTGGAYHVFTPFWRAAQAAIPEQHPLPAPARLESPAGPTGQSLDQLRLVPTRPDWAGGMRETWTPGEAAAASAFARFLESGLSRYAAERDLPAADTTSRLSPNLAFGEVGPQQIWAGIDQAGRDASPQNLAKLRSEVGWREFNWQLFAERPDSATRNMNPAFDVFPWAEPGAALPAWQRGRTGYPIVDAAMRQLWRTGWMHNRLRLVAASFLIKHLLIDWRLGEAWFWDTLVDADAASNAGNWQWVAGSGADAAPYFRIFNPVLQGKKFDAEGAFVRRHVPELARLPTRYIHEPWMAPRAVLDEAGVKFGTTYPAPIVVHEEARQRALAALATLRK